MKLYLLIAGLLFSSVHILAQHTDTLHLKERLREIYRRDQVTRKNRDSVSSMQRNDSMNVSEMEQIIAQFGWPGISFVGIDGNRTAFVVIQHAPLAVQEKYFALMEESVKKNESRPNDLALLKDRIRMFKNEPQIYGSQIVRNKDGDWIIYRISDSSQVDSLRRSVGLESLKEYAARFGIKWNYQNK